MSTRGLIYLVNAPRPDGGWIYFRTCDRSEAQRLADALGVAVVLDES
jgi:hypothetical protein